MAKDNERPTLEQRRAAFLRGDWDGAWNEGRDGAASLPQAQQSKGTKRGK